MTGKEALNNLLIELDIDFGDRQEDFKAEQYCNYLIDIIRKDLELMENLNKVGWLNSIVVATKLLDKLKPYFKLKNGCVVFNDVAFILDTDKAIIKEWLEPDTFSKEEE